MSLSPDELRELARYVLLTKPDEIGCDDWLGYAPSYAELVATLQPVPEPLQKAAAHLEMCPECAEEFRGLLAALNEDGAGSRGDRVARITSPVVASHTPTILPAARVSHASACSRPTNHPRGGKTARARVV